MASDRDLVLKNLKRQKVITLADVGDLLKCSLRTIHRRFKEWRALRSCNKNGKYYTLPEIPSFDDAGLWRYKGILFSTHGNLKKTLIHLVENAPAGLNSCEMEQLTGMAANNPIIYQLRDNSQIRLQRTAGRTVLFSADTQLRKAQVSERERRQVAPLPKCEDALMVFVELIKNPGIEPSQISRRLRRIGRKVSESSIQHLLARHGLSKKTPATRS